MLLLLLFFYFSLHTKGIPVFGFPSYQTCGVPFFLAASLRLKIPLKSRLYLRPTINLLHSTR